LRKKRKIEKGICGGSREYWAPTLAYSIGRQDVFYAKSEIMINISRSSV